MAGAVSTSIDAQIPPVAAPTSSVASDTRGKHRFLAELKRLEQETRYLEVSFVFCCCFFFFIDFGFLVSSHELLEVFVSAVYV